MKIEKRSGNLCEFDSNKIKTAIIQAMYDADEVDESVAEQIASDIESVVNSTDEIYSVDEIQDLVEEGLMETDFKQTAKAYIIYRHNKDNNRTNEREYKLLSKEFLSKYKHRPDPFKTDLGHFVYLRTYSRWLPEQGRRERWWETVARVVEYNCSLAPTSQYEAEKMYDNIFNLRQFTSGRSLWVGGSQASKEYPMSNFNCSFTILDDIRAYHDLFYLLLIGAGVGVRVLPKDVEKLPKFRTDFNIIHKFYEAESPENRQEHTSINFKDKNIAEIIIGDSKEAWTTSLYNLLDLLTNKKFRKINTIILNYDNIRPKGEKLKTFGGYASGFESIKIMFEKIMKVIKKDINKEGNARKLRPIDCSDIANIIGENVVSGGK